MVAFNFRGQFIEAVEAGRKRQTIRDTLRPGAHPGAAVQLYYGLRTKACRLLGAGVLDDIWEVEIGRLSNDEPFIKGITPFTPPAPYGRAGIVTGTGKKILDSTLRVE